MILLDSNVMVGANCSFYTTNHPTDPIMRNKYLQSAKPIIVKDNVWICSNVVVLAGVTIGENSIIGAGSIVTKDIPPNSFAVGNPCKVTKTLST